MNARISVEYRRQLDIIVISIIVIGAWSVPTAWILSNGESVAEFGEKRQYFIGYSAGCVALAAVHHLFVLWQPAGTSSCFREALFVLHRRQLSNSDPGATEADVTTFFSMCNSHYRSNHPFGTCVNGVEIDKPLVLRIVYTYFYAIFGSIIRGVVNAA